MLTRLQIYRYTVPD